MKGLKACVAKHRAEEKKFDALIAALDGKTDKASAAALKTFIRLRDNVRVAKAEVVGKIGRKTL